jgi:hypothetical protein
MRARRPRRTGNLSLRRLGATGVFERWVSSCPLVYRSGNAPDKRDVLNNGHAQVLGRDDRPVERLYAVGTDRASVMGGYYPSGGINLGPAMTFGYIVGRHAAGVSSRSPGKRVCQTPHPGGKYRLAGKFSTQNNLNSFGPPAGAASR